MGWENEMNIKVSQNAVGMADIVEFLFPFD